MCPRCEGMGNVTDIDLTQIYDESKSIAQGAITVPGYKADGWSVRLFAEAGLNPDKPIRDYTKAELHNSLGWLYLDDLGAEAGEEASAEGAGDALGPLQHPNALQCLLRHGLLRARDPGTDRVRTRTPSYAGRGPSTGQSLEGEEANGRAGRRAATGSPARGRCTAPGSGQRTRVN